MFAFLRRMKSARMTTRQRAASYKPNVEVLEDRTLPSLVIGGFDTSRSDGYSVPQGEQYSSLRSDLTATLPDASFTAASTLTSAYLSTINVLITTSHGPMGSTANALTPAEQTAVVNFVSAGGGAIILVDNNDFTGSFATTDPANQSYVSPFGLHVTGHLRNPSLAPATVTNPNHSVTNGLHGMVSSILTADPGWFDNLGSYATGLGRLSANNGVALAAINPGALSPTSGGVVFLSDFNAFDNSPFAVFWALKPL